MSTSMSLEKMAEWAFIIFVMIAVIAGLVVGYMHWPDSGTDTATLTSTDTWITLIMLILGVIVGLVSITAKEVTSFLMASIALIVTRVGVEVWKPLDIDWLANGILYYFAEGMLNYIVAFVAPAAVIIAIKQVYTLAKTK